MCHNNTRVVIIATCVAIIATCVAIYIAMHMCSHYCHMCSHYSYSALKVACQLQNANAEQLKSNYSDVAFSILHLQTDNQLTKPCTATGASNINRPTLNVHCLPPPENIFYYISGSKGLSNDILLLRMWCGKPKAKPPLPLPPFKSLVFVWGRTLSASLAYHTLPIASCRMDLMQNYFSK